MASTTLESQLLPSWSPRRGRDVARISSALTPCVVGLACAVVGVFVGFTLADTFVSPGRGLGVAFESSLPILRRPNSLQQQEYNQTWQNSLQQQEDIQGWHCTNGGDIYSDGKYVGSEDARVQRTSAQSHGTWQWSWTRTGNLEFWLINNAVGDSMLMPTGIGYVVWWNGQYVTLTKSTGASIVQLVSLSVPVASVPSGVEVDMQVSRNFDGTFTMSVAFQAHLYHATCSDSEYSTSNYIGIHWRQAQDGYLRGIEVSTWIPTIGAFQLQAEPNLAWPHDQRLVGSLNARATKLSRQAFGTWEWTWTRTGHLEFWLLNNAPGDSAYMWKGIGYLVWWDGEYVILSYSSGSTGHTMLELTVPSAQVPVGEEVSMTVTRTSAGLFTVSATYEGRYFSWDCWRRQHLDFQFPWHLLVERWGRLRSEG